MPDVVPRAASASPVPTPPQVSAVSGSFLPSAGDARAHAVGAGALELAEVIDELTLKELITLQVLRAVERHNGVSGAVHLIAVSTRKCSPTPAAGPSGELSDAHAECRCAR